MRKPVILIVLLSIAAAAHAQDWRVFERGAVFVTHVSETGPPDPQNSVFSTNWLTVGAERAFGQGSILFRGRFTAEPATVPDEGSPQLFQQTGGVADRMPGHEAVEEVAVQLNWRALRLYVAPKGEPALGATPYRQRASSIDFAEAPFAYDVQESFHYAKRVATAAIELSAFELEAGVFDEKSWSARATVHPTPSLSLQASHGSLGELKEKIDSASIGYDGKVLAVTGLWTRRESETAYGVEAAIRGGRSTFMARGENVRERTHVTVGYIFDVWHRGNGRAGVGANIDYHSNTKPLQATYGHKPQSVYVFLRARTD